MAVRIVSLGQKPYVPTHHAMQKRITELKGGTEAELWCVEHPSVFTQGQAGRPDHVLDPGTIPVVQSDRGGQVTYHGPGQAIVYTLIPLKAFRLNVRQLVTLLENAVIDVAMTRGVCGVAKTDAPGVYVEDKKLASLGLRIRQGVSYHGVAVNVAMDLAPFTRINPCGFAGLEVTDLYQCTGIKESASTVACAVASAVEDRLLSA